MSDQFSPIEDGRLIDSRYGAVETSTPASLSYVNESGLPDELVEGALAADRKLQMEIASQVERWTQSLNPVGPTRSLDMFARQKWDNATHPFAVMSMCAWAVENDDVLLTLGDVSEGLTFKKMRFELNDEDQQDMWNQWAEDVDLDSRMREMFRDLYKFSQVYVGMWWEQKAYRVRDSVVSATVAEMQRVKAAQAAAQLDPTTPPDVAPPPPPPSPGRGNRRRKKVFPVEIPTALTIFDPTKILPVGTLMFGRERFAYIATQDEDEAFGQAMAGEVVDPTVLQLIERKYTPVGLDLQVCRQLGIEPTRLWLMKKDSIFRHTLTKAQYERFPAFRLKPSLEIVNLKSHLRNADRAALIGNALRFDQRIATPGGWVPIRSLRVGDEVMGRDGRPTEVTGVFPQGERPLFRVVFSDGAEVIADDNHRWGVQSPDDRRVNQLRVMTTAQLRAAGLEQAHGRKKWAVPVVEALQLPDADLPVDPYLLGVLIGDGGLTQLAPRITWKEADQPALSKLGLMGCRGEAKFLPEDYLWASATQRWALLQGLFDTDGSPGQAGGVEYSTTSRRLADDVVQLAQSLGCLATVYTREATERAREAYRVYVQVPKGAVPFRRVRKAERFVQRKHDLVRSIVAIELALPDQAVCIAVAADDELFVTEGMVVTHNTNFIVVITKGTDKWPAKPQEIENLREQSRLIARLPVLVGDHRLNVDIVAPKLDNTLMETRWSVLDSRLVFAALRSFQPIMVGGNTGAGSGVTEMSRVISQGLENRRHQLIRAIEREVFKVVMARNEGVLSEAPNLAFAPKRVTLDFSTDIINAILKLRDRGDVSRETMLDEFDYDQDVEVVRRAREHALYDDVFNSSTPFNSPDNNPFGASQNGQPSNSGPAPAPAGTSPEGGRPPGARDSQPRQPAGSGN